MRSRSGRLILGVGAGWNQREYTAFGFPYDHRVSRFEEAFTIVRTLLADGRDRLPRRVTTPSTDSVLHPRSPRPGGPPLLIGSVGERMQAITLPVRRRLERVVERLRQHARRASPPGKPTVDARIAAIGRTGEVEATAAVYVKLPGWLGPSDGRLPAIPGRRSTGHARGRRSVAAVRRGRRRPRPAGGRSDRARQCGMAGRDADLPALTVDRPPRRPRRTGSDPIRPGARNLAAMSGQVVGQLVSSRSRWRGLPAPVRSRLLRLRRRRPRGRSRSRCPHG